MDSIKPTCHFPPLWQRRASLVSLFIAVLVSGLGAYAVFKQGSTGSLMELLPVVLALSGGLFVLVNLLPVPQKTGVVFGFIGYVIIAGGLAVALLGDPGQGIHTLYVLLFCIVVFIGGLYGPIALLGLALFSAGYVVNYLTVYSPGLGEKATLAFVYTVPLVASWLLWHGTARHSKNQPATPQLETDTTYNELAAQLTQVANESDIVINSITDGVLTVDGKGLIRLINPAAARMLGWTKGDSIGLDFRNVIRLQDVQGTPYADDGNPIALTLTTNMPNERADVYILTNSNKTFQARVQVSPVGQYGRGVVVVFRDITKEKAEEREQAEFVSTASHEMRTPVAAIEGYLGLALNPNTAAIDAKARTYLTKAHESAQHLGRLFQDLLDITKADDGRLRNTPTVTELVGYVGEIVYGFNAKATEKGLTLVYEPSQSGAATEKRVAPVFYADVDNDHLREVLGNLVDNAIKYTKSGTVIIGVTGDRDSVEVTVRDSGIGIPREDIGHLFQKFYRVDNTDTREIGGTGLGLYLSRRLVEIMGGKIWVDSEYGKGSMFTVSLPRLEYEVAKARLQAMMEQKARQLEIERSKQLNVPPR